LHVLLDALQGTSFPVVIAGSGPEEAALKEGALRLGLQHVHFLGSLPDEDKAALFHLCTGMVFPSCLRSEAFGISLLEGAMYGKPLICCEIGTGTTFINVHGETGLAVPPFDPAALREAMRRIWDNPAMADAMGRAARERFEKLFTAGRMVADYARLYEETLARHSRREVRS
jgi:rhamnosyl/mannosyltransferase